MKIKIILLLIISTSILSCDSCTKCIEVDIPYTDEEPYLDVEQIDVTLSYQSGNLYYQRHDGAVLFNENPSFEVYAEVTNTSKHNGVFELYASVTSQGNEIYFKESKYILSGQTEKISQIKEINPYSFMTNQVVENWGVNPPTIRAEQEVTRYRSVTKYRNCNSCYEDCGKYIDKSDNTWIIYVIVGIIVIAGLRWFFD